MHQLLFYGQQLFRREMEMLPDSPLLWMFFFPDGDGKWGLAGGRGPAGAGQDLLEGRIGPVPADAHRAQTEVQGDERRYQLILLRRPSASVLWNFCKMNVVKLDGFDCRRWKADAALRCSALIQPTLFAFRGPGTELFDYLWVPLWSRVCFVHMCSLAGLQTFSSSPALRCGVCVPAPKPGAQRSRSPNAGHPQAPDRARLPPARPAAPPAGRLDQGRRRAAALADETARCRAGGGRPQPGLHRRRHLPLPHDVRWSH